MKHFLNILFLFGLTVTCLAQKNTRILDYERSSFNQDLPLPAEEYFFISGKVADPIQQVQLNIYRGEGNQQRRPIYQNSWVRSFDNASQTFSLPVNFRLESDEIYDLEVQFFRKATRDEIVTVRQAIGESLENYLRLNLYERKGEIRLRQSPDEMLRELNRLTEKGLEFYANRSLGNFKAFSDMPAYHFRQLRGQELEVEKAVRLSKKLLMTELNSLINEQLLIMNDQRMLENYPSERIKKPITLHVGYASVFFNDELDNLQTSSSGMAGLSLPFERHRYNSRFLANSALLVGVFFTELKNENDEKLEGPLFDIPLYVGLGYQALQVLRINAGATALEVKNGDGGVFVRPWLGLTLDIDVWAQLSR